jgi:hypothetical protein
MIKSRRLKCAVAGLVLLATLRCQSQSLWDLANENKGLLKIATLFTAQNVRDHLGTEEGVSKAIDWCKKTGVTHVFIETFRSRYTAERRTLERAKSRFEAEGFEVSGCVTTTQVGKISTGWNLISCYTNTGTQKSLQEIFEYTASMFDEIMIDDFLFTDCQCGECKKARGGRTWADYRCELMVEVGRERILRPARAVNPNVKIIIKYPQWYDNFHNRGYEVSRQTADYDRIWVGTETRDYEDKRWGGKVQYEAYYIMRWLGEIGGSKTGGGWFDPYGTTENTYVEQARQTVLADATGGLTLTGPRKIHTWSRRVRRYWQMPRRCCCFVMGRCCGIPGRQTSRNYGRRFPDYSSSPDWCGINLSKGFLLQSR